MLRTPSLPSLALLGLLSAAFAVSGCSDGERAGPSGQAGPGSLAPASLGAEPSAAHAEPCAAGSACVAALGEGPAAAPSGAGVPRLLEFEAAYCAACATMAPVVTSLVKSCAKASEVVQRVDIGKQDGEALARHYQVASLPTFLAVDAEGHEVFRKVGVQQPAELASIVAEVTGRDCSVAN